MIDPLRVTIVGGGLAGPLMACLAARSGHTVTLIEQRSDPRKAGYSGGRSINLALSARGREALRRIELEDRVLEDVVAMPGRMIHDVQGRTSFQAYSCIPGEAILSVSRGGLNCMLLDAAEACDGVTIVFGDRCTSIDLDAPSVQLESSKQIDADLIIGTDGAASVVRAAMDNVAPIDAGGGLIDATYKELCIPAGPDGQWLMEPHALHIWPRGNRMMIALPNADGSFTVTCFWPASGPESFEALPDRAAIEACFGREYQDAIKLMPTLVEDFLGNPTGVLGTVRCNRFHHGDSAVLVGDAAHAVVPFFGQGMNAAFQGCLKLIDSMERSDDLATALAGYDALHRVDAGAISDLALQNFIEMRSHTASRVFRLKTSLQKRLNGLFPRAYQPLYNLISFSTMPYSEVVELVRRRHRRMALIGGVLTGLVVFCVLFLTGVI